MAPFANEHFTSLFSAHSLRAGGVEEGSQMHARCVLAPGYLLPPALQARCCIERNLSDGYVKTLLKKTRPCELVSTSSQKSRSAAFSRNQKVVAAALRAWPELHSVGAVRPGPKSLDKKKS